MTFPTHALFDTADRFLGEVTPNALNSYPASQLVALPATYWTPGYRWTWAGRTPTEDAALVEADQIAAVKAKAELLKMQFLTAGGAKKTEYADKAAEVRVFWTLGGSVSAILSAIALWPDTRRRAVFPYATASAAVFGETAIGAAIARFEAGIASSAATPAIAAAEEKATKAIRAATTAAAKRTAAAAAVWPA